MADKDSKAVAKSADKNQKNKKKIQPLKAIKQWWTDMVGEVKKLTWLSKKDLLSHTVAVFVFVIAMAVVIWILDLAFGSGMRLLEGIGR